MLDKEVHEIPENNESKEEEVEEAPAYTDPGSETSSNA